MVVVSFDDLQEYLAQHGDVQPPLTRRERLGLVLFVVALVGVPVVLVVTGAQVGGP